MCCADSVDYSGRDKKAEIGGQLNYGFLCPLKDGLALYFPEDLWMNPPQHTLGVAHTAYEHDKEEKLTLFSPREVSDEELSQVEPFIHDVQFRSQARRYLGKAIFTPATQLLLGRFHFVLQIFGLGSILMCLYLGRYQADDIAIGIYWVILLPMFVAIARGLMAAHGKETLAGLKRLYHSPIGVRVVVLPQLKKIEEILNNGEPYSRVLEQVRDLGLPELVGMYKRASQYPRWTYGEGPNPCGVIRANQA